MSDEEDLKYLESILNTGGCTKREERWIKREIKYLHGKKSLHIAWNELINAVVKEFRLYELLEWLSKKLGGFKK